MKFSDIVKQATTLLQDKGQISYRMLKREFTLDDETLDDLKAELIEVDRLAVDQDGKMLVWIGERIKGEKDKRINGNTEGEKGKWGNGEKEGVPGQWTPPHLAERIRAVSVAEGERKTITALFADLKGSTALIEGLDPEEARAIIDPALQLMMDAVHRYEGYVAQALGDGIFALFGAPLAHEDHPQRALYAALRMQEEMRRYGDTLRMKGYPPLAMRVGVNTGEVVVRSIRKEDLHTDYVPIGHSTNLAARMEQLAAPGSILVTEQTHKLTDGYFEFKNLGQTHIKGVEEPLHVYEVLGAGPLRTRLQVSATRRGLTRFVGRQSELDQMQRAFEQAKAGHGQIVGVMGEPGLGKSRLFYEFKLLSQGRCLVLEAYSVSYGKASPYLPVIELLKSYFDIQPQDEERKRHEKVTGKVLTLDRSLEDTLPYLFALLGMEEQPSPLQQMDPQIRRKRTFDAIKKLFLRESLNQPLLLIFEDLHWIDSETQGFLDVLSESVASAKLLLLTNYRPEYRHEWGQKTYYTQLRLAPFGRVEAEEFLDALLGAFVGADLRVGPQGPGAHIGAPLQHLKSLILEKTEGTPFFMEEVVQELREQGMFTGGEAGRSSLLIDLHIPTTVQGVLAARIDRLTSEEKALLQQLSVIGREFPLNLIRQVISQSEDGLYRLLSALQHKEFLYEQPAFPEVEYIFKHALTQEVAYNSVLHERRKALHEQTAQAIEALFSSKLEDHYSDLAHHYSRSGNTEKAVHYLYLAGQQAAHRSANTEAIAAFTTALDLLKTLPDTTNHAQQELELNLALGALLIATKGYGSPDVEHVYARAQELCLHLGESPQLLPALLGLFVVYLTRAAFPSAREFAEKLLNVAREQQDERLLASVYSMLGLIASHQGEFQQARSYFEQGIVLHDPQQHRCAAFVYGQDAEVACRSISSFPLWMLGYPDQALQRSCDGFHLAQELSHPLSVALALGWNALVHRWRREDQATREKAEGVIAFCIEHGFPLWLSIGTILQGCVSAEHDAAEKGIPLIEESLASLRTTGTELGRPFYLLALAEACKHGGQTEKGISTLTEALSIVNRTHQHGVEAELYRLRGELTLAQSKTSLGQVQCKSQTSQNKSQANPGKSEEPKSQILNPKPQEEAEVCFLKAIEVARKQQAKSLELRATMSLARLWQQQGKTTEAHQMLSKVYNWFTEGFDTKDLQEAKVLLEELSISD